MQDIHIKNYVGDLSGRSLLIAETRIIASIQLENLSDKQWQQRIIEDNVLQKKSTQTASRFAKVIRKRLNAMGNDYTQALIHVSDRAYVQLLLAGFIVQYPIISDFMRECLAEAKRTYKPTISTHAWSDFFEDRMRVFPALANYSASTQKRMGSHVIKALVDAGYLNSPRQRQLQVVYLLPEVIATLSKINKQELIAVMECTQ